MGEQIDTALWPASQEPSRSKREREKGFKEDVSYKKGLLGWLPLSSGFDDDERMDWGF